MINEELIHYIGQNQLVRNTERSIKEIQLLKIFNEGFPRLQGTISQLNHGFDGDSPVPIAPFWKQLFIPASTQINIPPIPTVLQHIEGITQQDQSDCVGAVALSVISTIAGTPITQKLYDDFLSLALKYRLATRNESGIQVYPSILNILTTPEYISAFPSQQIAISYKKNLTLFDISKVAQDLNKQKDRYHLFVLCPVSSWKDAGGGHLVAMQGIGQDNVTVYDPNEPNRKVLSHDEFSKHWKYNHNSSISIFKKK